MNSFSLQTSPLTAEESASLSSTSDVSEMAVLIGNRSLMRKNNISISDNVDDIMSGM